MKTRIKHQKLNSVSMIVIDKPCGKLAKNE